LSDAQLNFLGDAQPKTSSDVQPGTSRDAPAETWIDDEEEDPTDSRLQPYAADLRTRVQNPGFGTLLQRVLTCLYVQVGQESRRASDTLHPSVLLRLTENVKAWEVEAASAHGNTVDLLSLLPSVRCVNRCSGRNRPMKYFNTKTLARQITCYHCTRDGKPCIRSWTNSDASRLILLPLPSDLRRAGATERTEGFFFAQKLNFDRKQWMP